jgi:hypothetical protein
LSDLATIEKKLDLIIRSLGLDDSNTRQEMERKAPVIVDMMQKRLTKRTQKSKKEV